jgi:hypothetical protein
MAKTTITGTVIQLMDNTNAKVITIETKPAVAPKDNKPGTPAKRVVIQTNDHSNLAGIERGNTIKITIE